MSNIAEKLRRNTPHILDSDVRLEAAAEIERLRGALDAVTTVEGNIMELERKATQRGARMQKMRESMSSHSWDVFCKFHPEAAEWFDEDGVPR